MFPLCNVKECKARLLTSKRVVSAQEIEDWYVNFCVGNGGEGTSPECGYE